MAVLWTSRIAWWDGWSSGRRLGCGSSRLRGDRDVTVLEATEGDHSAPKPGPMSYGEISGWDEWKERVCDSVSAFLRSGTTARVIATARPTNWLRSPKQRDTTLSPSDITTSWQTG